MMTLDNANPHSAPANEPSPAVCIPEILERIFSHLNQTTLRTHVRLVSRDWNVVCEHFLDVTSTIKYRKRAQVADLDVEQREREHMADLDVKLPRLPGSSIPFGTRALLRLASSTCLDLRFFAPWYHPNPFPPNYLYMTIFGSVTWSEFLDKDGPLTRQGTQRTVRQLHLYGDDTLTPYVQTIFKRLQDHALTNVQIVLHRIIQGFLRLGELLALCPFLHTLHIESLDHTGNIYNQSPSYPRLERSSVVSITLKGIKIDQPNMEAILEQHGQYLQKLHIISVRRISYPDLTDLTLPYVEVFDRREFYQTTARTCPNLKSFHFSFFKPDPDEDSTDILMDAFPALQELSLSNSDLTQYNTRMHTYLQQLTGLEIVQKVVTTDAIARAFHQILCDAPNLLSVKAPEFGYRAEYLDVQGLKQFWACRRLRTLHLGFDSMITKRFFTKMAATRLVYGYLVKVAPLLEDLELTGITLNMELEGGLCLLSRLKKLEHLKLQSCAVVNFDEADLGWLGAGNARGAEWTAREVLGSTWSQRVQEQLTLLQDDNDGQFPQDSLQELTVRDFNKVGWVEDVQDCLNELALLAAQWKMQKQEDHAQQRLDPNPVWPRFESFGFRFPLNRLVSHDQVLLLREIVHKYRPAAELDIQQVLPSFTRM
ncbi:hypothetical protein BG006_002296 [Podila minutissima]|uniref:F-box domain-containing protein n=1 Tax=Podila minutissima TaxID=64525 RepID=A0A9P5VNT6_9FUNG|nr:hypothetical protein BG006_002296 [Podila minutissima]